ncbi:MAG TPA: hypothetical protein VFP72_10140, partial [Kineosporiaceae bacterium]|nr:hypothetical protein [Kineosporiaceae bacterium]
MLNVTVTQPSAAGWVAVYPAGAVLPLASNLNFTPGMTVANQVIAKVGAGGAVRLYNVAGSTHLIADLQGFMAAGSSFTGQSPARILDTRSGLGASGPVGAGATIEVQVSGTGGVPASGVSAVAMNVTATDVGADTYVTVFPTGAPARPLASNLNPGRGSTVPVLVLATLGTAGKVSLFNAQGGMNLIADVAGWFSTGGEYHALTPARLLDTRDPGMGALGQDQTLDMQVSGYGGVPIAGDAAVVLSLTAVTPSSYGYLTEYPYAPNSTPPLASNLNFNAGQTVPNLVIAKVGAGGWISIYNRLGNTHVIVDVMGWFATTDTQG